MDFYFDGYNYKQRTNYSKIIKIENDKIIDRLESINDLPLKAKEEYEKIVLMEKHPENFFKIKVAKSPISIIEIEDIKEPIRNLKIPDYINGVPVGYVYLDSSKSKKIEYAIFENHVKLFPYKIFSENDVIRKIILSEEMLLSNGALINKENLKEIKISNKEKNIPKNCFYGCKNLEKININNIENINHCSFYKCKNLNIDLPDKLKKIGFKAFAKSGIKEITIPKSVIKIDELAFSQCENLIRLNSLTDIKLPNNLTEGSKIEMINKEIII